MKPWLLIAGDFTPLGGMDHANHALAVALAAAGGDVHLVSHRVWPDLEAQPSGRVHRVERPLNSHLLGAPRLASAGARLARQFGSAATVVANGGNADTGDVNWVHYLHAAHTPRSAGMRQRLQSHATHRYYVARERQALMRARVIVCNSRRTSLEIAGRLGIEASRLRVVYYGSDAVRFARVTAEERAAARRHLGWPADRPAVVFIGALGDRRKGFDRLFAAWRTLCRESRWDAGLIVVGHGSELAAWRRRTAEGRLEGHIRFLGFRDDVPRVLAASDLLVHPARYEAYGLGVHEAICRGIPAIVSADAGVAELYPDTLRDLLIADVEDIDGIAERIRHWRSNIELMASRVVPLSDRLRSRSWDDMAAEIVRVTAA
jgi:glycosyltransferase involved in cell wall biosynthesis